LNVVVLSISIFTLSNIMFTLSCVGEW